MGTERDTTATIVAGDLATVRGLLGFLDLLCYTGKLKAGVFIGWEDGGVRGGGYVYGAFKVTTPLSCSGNSSTTPYARGRLPRQNNKYNNMINYRGRYAGRGTT